MSNPTFEYPRSLRLRPGEEVEVRSKQEILTTLDARGCLDDLPFMPEMLAFCGRRMRVYRSAHKVCNTIDLNTTSRSLTDSVHLDGARCTGEEHGACDALCLLYWKEAWLKRVRPRRGRSPAQAWSGACDETGLMSAARPGGPEENRYACQATELNRATTPIRQGDLRPYIRDLTSGNVGPLQFLRTLSFWLFTRSLRLGAYRLQLRIYNSIKRVGGGVPYPFARGKLDQTPAETLDLQEGEWVEVKSHQEILTTLNRRNRNRGMYFDAEMVPYCGRRYRVLKRVERIIDERTGNRVEFSDASVILDGVICRSRYSECRYFCPRAIHSFWREIWLKRVDQGEGEGEGGGGGGGGGASG